MATVNDAPAALSKTDLETEVGASGLLQYSGYITEDRPKSGQSDWIPTFRQMMTDEPIIKAILQAFELLVRSVEWDFADADETPAAQANTAFVRDAWDDMTDPWENMLSEIITMLPFGWALLEQTYKRRCGPNRDPLQSSRFDDGRIGWARWALRSQETRLRWQFDEYGNVEGMIQLAPPRYVETFLPMEKCLLFRTVVRRGNPEGESILRAAYRPWYFKQKVEQIEGIGIERDLAGLPVYGVPYSVMEQAANSADPKNAAAVATINAVQRVIQNIRRDSQEGVIVPMQYDDHGHPLYELKLLSTGGSRQFDTDKTITRYGQQIAMSCLADFIYVGHEQRGSFALIQEKTRLFQTAINGYLNGICAVVNNTAIPRLLRLNGMDETLVPQLTHGDVQEPDLGQLAAFLTALGAAKIDVSDPEIRNHLFALAGLPTPVVEGDRDETGAALPEASAPGDEETELA